MSIEKDLSRIADAVEVIADAVKGVKIKSLNEVAQTVVEPESGDGPEAEQVEIEEPDDGEPTKKDVRKALTDMQKAINEAEDSKTAGPDVVKVLLKKCGVTTVGKLDPSDFAKAIRMAEKKLAKVLAGD